MEAVMNKVYKSFDQLMEENEEIFEVLKKKGGSGLYRAIWEARDVDIEVLEEGLSNQINENFIQNIFGKDGACVDDFEEAREHVEQQFRTSVEDFVKSL